MAIDLFREKIKRISATNSNVEFDKSTFDSMNDLDLFIWLNEQDNSLRYHLALELDVPLQHLEHTCSTLKHIQNLLGSTSSS